MTRFFDNRGAVIGVFLVVGIVLACLSWISLWCFRRHRQDKRRFRAENPFENRSPTLPHHLSLDLASQPSMSTTDHHYHHRRHSGVGWERVHLTRNNTIGRQVAIGQPTLPQTSLLLRPVPDAFGVQHTGLRGQPRSLNHHYDGPLNNRYHAGHRSPIDPFLGIDGAEEERRAQSRVQSYAPSSPSIYPSSLPDEKPASISETEAHALHIPPQRLPENRSFVSASLETTGKPVRPPRVIRPPPAAHREPVLTPTAHVSPQSGVHDSTVSGHNTSFSSISDDNMYRALRALETNPAPEVFLRRSYSKRMALNVCYLLFH